MKWLGLRSRVTQHKLSKWLGCLLLHYTAEGFWHFVHAQHYWCNWGVMICMVLNFSYYWICIRGQLICLGCWAPYTNVLAEITLQLEDAKAGLCVTHHLPAMQHVDLSRLLHRECVVLSYLLCTFNLNSDYLWLIIVSYWVKSLPKSLNLAGDEHNHA